MKIPGCLIIILILALLLNRKLRKPSHSEEDFWENERKANSARKKSLDNLHYITIPTDSLPFFYDFDKKLDEIQNHVTELAGKKIVNLTGITNTRLKLDYGASNLDTLSGYDDNFTDLARTVYSWGLRLSELGQDAAAIAVLEFGVACGIDIYNHYMLLGQLYVKHGQSSKLPELITSAESLPSLTRDRTVRDLKALADSSV